MSNASSNCFNQHRTDLVERIDDYFMSQFASVQVQPDAPINTETPGWAVDRLSILALKISKDVELNNTDKPEVLCTSTMHGDEGICATTALSFCRHLLENYGSDSWRTIFPTSTAWT